MGTAQFPDERGQEGGVRRGGELAGVIAGAKPAQHVVDDEELYDWCRRSILTLDALETDFSNFHLRFLLEFATVMGFSPSADDLAPFAGEHFSKVQLLLKGSAADSLLVPMNGAERNEVASLLLDYIGWHTETKIAVRSLGVLRELYK